MFRHSKHLSLSCLLAASAIAQAPAPGMRLFQGVYSGETKLMDTAGNVVHVFPGTNPALCSHLSANGTLLRTSITDPFPATGVTGKIQRVAFDGTVLWDYELDGPTYFLHHDFCEMPNGNVLAIVWHLKTDVEAIALGRDPALLAHPGFYPDAIVELQQTGPNSAAIVWEWQVWDHMIQDFDPTKPNYGVVADNPGRININFPPVVLTDGDWNHCNGIDYDPINDWIVISAREQNEIWIIDHSTTTAEAAGTTGGLRGRGGDLLYRWGNAEAHGRGGPGDRQLGGQHDPRFIPPGYPGAGNLTLFNNAVPGQVRTSAVYELVLPIDASGNFYPEPNGRYGPLAPVWSYSASTFFFSPFVSSAQRLPNGNTLVCSGAQSLLFEVDPTGNPVWVQTGVHGGPVFQCDYVERNLWASGDSLSVVSGGTVAFDGVFGSPANGNFYMLLGSISGTAPGIQIGNVLLPLNPDFLTFAMVNGLVPAFQGVFQNYAGLLDGDGAMQSQLVVPGGLIPIELAGSTLHFSVFTVDNAVLPVAASNPMPVLLRL